MKTTSTATAAPVFKPVEWVPAAAQEDTGGYVMLSRIRDLASGVAVALQIIEKSAMNVDLGDDPILDGSDVSRLIRMSVAAMSLIEGCIDEHFDEMIELGAASRERAKS